MNTCSFLIAKNSLKYRVCKTKEYKKKKKGKFLNSVLFFFLQVCKKLVVI